MSVLSAMSFSTSATECARELKAQMGGAKLTLVVFFATPDLDPKALGQALRAEFGDVPAIGCTSAGEIGQGKLVWGSVVMMGFDEGTVEAAAVVSLGSHPSRGDVAAALDQFEKYAGERITSLDPERFVGLVLHDGMSAHEEVVMSELSARCNVPFVGGSAGDNERFEQCHVFAGLQAVPSGNALSLIRPAKPYRVLKTQSFSCLEATLEATEVRAGTRVVRAFNGRPAAEEYARHLGCGVADLRSALLANHPLGLMVGNAEPWVRSPAKVAADGSMTFFCEIKQGMKLRLLAKQDVVQQTKEDLSEALGLMSSCSGALGFHCIQRTHQLQQEGRVEEYAALLQRVPTVGFCTYGESYIGHINQTLTMVLFG